MSVSRLIQRFAREKANVSIKLTITITITTVTSKGMTVTYRFSVDGSLFLGPRLVLMSL